MIFSILKPSFFGMRGVFEFFGLDTEKKKRRVSKKVQQQSKSEKLTLATTDSESFSSFSATFSAA